MAIRVQRVQIKNFKAIKDLDKEIEGKSVFLLGENGLGKSSFMQAIQIALGSSDAIPENFKGEGVVDTTINGEPYSFAFKAGKDGKPKLTVTLPNGLKEDKKGVIGGIVGSLSFDINEFVKMSETTAGKKKQVEEFKKLLPKEFTDGLAAFELKVKNLYEDRTELGRKISTLEGFIKESKLFGADLKRKPVDVGSLNADLEKANEHNNKIKEVTSRHAERAISIAAKATKIEQLKAEIAELERTMATEEQVQKNATDWLAKNEPINTSEMVNAINNASENNTIAAQAAEQNKKIEQLDAFKSDYEELTVQIEVNKQAISDAIKDFDSPVDGLAFDADSLLYNGVPVDANNLSTSEIIELGIKMKYASNPDLGLMFVEHANEIGTKRLQDIMEYAKKYNLQMFFEEVKRGQDSLEIQFVEE